MLLIPLWDQPKFIQMTQLFFKKNAPGIFFSKLQHKFTFNNFNINLMSLEDQSRRAPAVDVVDDDNDNADAISLNYDVSGEF